METFYALLAICAENSPVTGEFATQRPVTRNFDVFFDLRLNKRLSKQPWGWWFETPSRPLWHHCNVTISVYVGHKIHVWQLSDMHFLCNRQFVPVSYIAVGAERLALPWKYVKMDSNDTVIYSISVLLWVFCSTFTVCSRFIPSTQSIMAPGIQVCVSTMWSCHKHFKHCAVHCYCVMVCLKASDSWLYLH